MPCAGQILFSTSSAQGMALFHFHTVDCSATMCIQIYVKVMIYVDRNKIVLLRMVNW